MSFIANDMHQPLERSLHGGWGAVIQTWSILGALKKKIKFLDFKS